MSRFKTVDQGVNPDTPAAGRTVWFSLNGAAFIRNDSGDVVPLAGGITRIVVADIDDPSTELNPISGAFDGDLIIATEVVVAGEDAYTIYAWDSDVSGGENVPFTVDGTGGRWVAFAGRYVNQILESAADENKIRFHYATFVQLPSPSSFHGMFAHVHDQSDPLLGESAYFAHAGSWQMIKDHHNDDEVTLTPAASVEIDFGKQSRTYQSLTLDQNTTLTEANAIAGVRRVLRISSGDVDQTLTFPGNWEVFGTYDDTGAPNLIYVECVSPTVEEIQAGGAPGAAYIAHVVNNLSSGGGGSTIFGWKFKTATAEADPGSGFFRMNNSTPASVTSLFVSSVTDGGLNLDNFLADLRVGEEIVVQQGDDPSKVIAFEITSTTDNTGWWSIGVTVLDAIGTLFGNNRVCAFVFHTGDAGGDVNGPGSAVDTNLAAFNGTTGKLIQDSGISTAVALRLGTTSGILTGCEVTINGGDPAHFDVAAGTVMIWDWSSGLPTPLLVTFAGATDVTLTGLATDLFTALFIDNTGSLVQQPGVLSTAEQRRELACLQAVVHLDNLTITLISDSSQPAYDLPQALLDYVIVNGPLNIGNQFSAASTDLTLAKAAGSTTLPFINRSMDTQDPTTRANAAVAAYTVGNPFNYSHQDGVGGFTIVLGNDEIDPDNYDDGSGTLAAVPNNNWQLQYIYFFGQTEQVTIVYGQAVYSSLANALAAIGVETTNHDPAVTANGVLINILAIEEGATDLSDTLEACFKQPGTGAGAGGSTGDVIGPGSSTDNAIARFDGTSGKVIQNSLVTISDTGSLSLPALETVDGRDVSADGLVLDALTTKTVWFEPDYNGPTLTYRRRSIGATASFQFTFRVPDDFLTLVSLEIVGIPGATYTGVGEIDLESNYAQDGEAISTHNETNSLTALSGTINVHTPIDVSSVFSSLAAGDNCGIELDHVTGLGAAINYIGIRLEYSTV